MFALADLVVLPYRSASQSGVIPIAAMLKKPVVATSVGGLVEALAGSGSLVALNDPAALALAIERALESPPMPPPDTAGAGMSGGRQSCDALRSEIRCNAALPNLAHINRYPYDRLADGPFSYVKWLASLRPRQSAFADATGSYDSRSRPRCWRIRRSSRSAIRYVWCRIDESSAKIAAQNLNAGGRGRIVNGTPEDLDEVFDAVCAFEVLERVDDSSALRIWRDRVQPGGWLVLSVPAWQGRWGAHDVRAGHFRRYEPDGLRSRLGDAGFEDVSVLAYGFPLLSALHPMWNALSARAAKEETLEARTRASSRFRQPPRVVAPATMLLSAPFRVAQRPFVDTRRGTGLIAFARRPV